MVLVPVETPILQLPRTTELIFVPGAVFYFHGAFRQAFSYFIFP